MTGCRNDDNRYDTRDDESVLKIVQKRLSRDDLLMTVAKLYQQRSTCLRRQVGAVIGIDGRTLAPGYNGAPHGMPHCTRSTCNEERPCTIAAHAEANAIAWAARKGIKTNGSTLYTTVSPCMDCAMLIINAGIVEVIYLEEYRDTSAIEYLRKAHVICEKSSL